MARLQTPVHFLRTFGCVAHVKNTDKHLAKLNDRSTPMVFVGYEPGTKGYRFYNPASGRVCISRDAVFKEERAWDWGAEKGAGPDDDIEPFQVEFLSVPLGHGGPAATPPPTGPITPPTPTTLALPTTSVTVVSPAGGQDPRMPTPPATPPAMPTPGIEFASPPSDELDLDVDHDDNVPLRFRTMENILGTPLAPGLAEREVAEELMVAVGEDSATAEEAKRNKEWRAAMLEEMASIKHNKTWSLVNLPPGHRAISLKWVFKLKHGEHGNVIKHKAWLVAKGYVQR